MPKQVLKAGAIQMFIPETLAEVQVSYSSRIAVKDRFKINSSMDVANAFRQVWPSFEHVEYFYILLLNRANHVLGYHQVSKGGVSGTVVDPKIIFQIALKCNASNIIIAHNHPSGNTDPSSADKEITRKIKEVGMMLEIPVIDHLILTESDYLSFADEGLL